MSITAAQDWRPEIFSRSACGATFTRSSTTGGMRPPIFLKSMEKNDVSAGAHHRGTITRSSTVREDCSMHGLTVLFPQW